MMPFGDVGGAVTELIITCTTPPDGQVAITRGDALKLSGNYTVTNQTREGDPIFGQAMASANANGVAIPVKVRGICVFDYDGEAPAVNGIKGVIASSKPGIVKSPWSQGAGIAVKVDQLQSKVHVLL